jgi:hypothetical protein
MYRKAVAVNNRCRECAYKILLLAGVYQKTLLHGPNSPIQRISIFHPYCLIFSVPIQETHHKRQTSQSTGNHPASSKIKRTRYSTNDKGHGNGLRLEQG